MPDDEADTEIEASEETEHEGERVMNRADGAAILREVAAGVEDGEIAIEGENGFTATIPDRFELEVEYEVAEGEAELEVELEWSVGDGASMSADG
ncbi:amphi-Trp domain-containing protein [Halovivax cerinus]|uniref:Amphi-Trp domain-containing protein n=1 Tax=Halovivax cerinus TaxID=1487865 RepID=A0ABD5NJK1_9EURY|nr:amphi-Trp domain-containing protein [Halovivax cerinus]